MNTDTTDTQFRINIHEPMDELLERSQRGNAAVPGGSSGRRDYRGDTWYGGVTYEEAITFAREGDPASAQMVNEMAERIIGDVEAKLGPVKKPRLRRRPAGSRPIPTAVIRGEPSFMLRQESLPRETRVMRITHNLAASAMISPEELRMRGAYVAAVVRALEARRVRTEIVVGAAINTSYGRDDASYLWRTTIKEAGDYIDMDAVAFWIAHPAAFRRIIFGVMEEAPAEDRQRMGVPRGGYGYPSDFPESEHGDIYIGRRDTRITMETARTQVIELLEKHGLYINAA